MARAPRVSFQTLGCKVNQYESRQIAAEMVRRGFRLVPFGQPADACVVNTCSVTEQADARSRASIRRALRSGDDPLVFATGCGVETNAPAAGGLSPRLVVAPNARKPDLAEEIEETLRRSGRLLFDLPPAGTPDGELIRLLEPGEGALARTRAVIKVQDGCNHFCSFCIIPFTRGRLRSRPATDVLEEARALADLGYREVVLTGICLGDYGDERGQPRGERDPLAALLEALAGLPGLDRIRMSSIDPADLTEDLLSTMAALPQVCPHLHLSLQSGDDEVLRRMRRRYDRARFRDWIDRIYAALPDAGLSCDVIAGFPGETEAQFERTVSLCEEARFLKIHAFPYSPRPGTQAARLADDVPPAEKRRRVAALNALSARQCRAFAERRIGSVLEVLAEQRDQASGMLTGLAPSYLRVVFAGPDVLCGESCRVRITGAADPGAVGELVEQPDEGARRER